MRVRDSAVFVVDMATQADQCVERMPLQPATALGGVKSLSSNTPRAQAVQKELRDMTAELKRLKHEEGRCLIKTWSWGRPLLIVLPPRTREYNKRLIQENYTLRDRFRSMQVCEFTSR